MNEGAHFLVADEPYYRPVADDPDMRDTLDAAVATFF